MDDVVNEKFLQKRVSHGMDDGDRVQCVQYSESEISKKEQK